MYHSMSQPSTQLLNLTLSSTLHSGCFPSFEGSLCILHFPGALNKIIESFLVHDSTKPAKSVWPSFLLSSAAAYNSVAWWMLFFTINWLTSNLERRLGLLFWAQQLFGRGFWSCRGVRGLGFPRVPVYFCWLFGSRGGYIFQIRVILTVGDWCIFLADVSISRVVVVMLIWEIDHNPLWWCDAFLYRLLTFRASEFQSNMIVISAIVMFFKGASPVLHFTFPRSFVEMGFNAFSKFFSWRKF